MTTLSDVSYFNCVNTNYKAKWSKIDIRSIFRACYKFRRFKSFEKRTQNLAAIDPCFDNRSWLQAEACFCSKTYFCFFLFGFVFCFGFICLSVSCFNVKKEIHVHVSRSANMYVKLYVWDAFGFQKTRDLIQSHPRLDYKIAFRYLTDQSKITWKNRRIYSGMDSSVPLMHHAWSEWSSIDLIIKKTQNPFLDSRIQSSIFLKKRTLRRLLLSTTYCVGWMRTFNTFTPIHTVNGGLLIEYFPSTLCWRNLKTKQSLVLLGLYCRSFHKMFFFQKGLGVFKIL